jgi:hypothetical protein
MEQERVVLLAMDSIYTQCPDLTTEEQEIIAHHLRLSFGAGHDEGRKQTAHGKEIIQLKNGKEVQRFSNCQEAANFYKVTKTAISKNATRGTTDKRGFQWRYADATDIKGSSG